MLHSPRTFFVLNYLGTLKAAETYFSLGALGSCVTYEGGDGSVKRVHVCFMLGLWLMKENQVEVVEFPAFTMCLAQFALYFL